MEVIVVFMYLVVFLCCEIIKEWLLELVLRDLEFLVLERRCLDFMCMFRFEGLGNW